MPSLMFYEPGQAKPSPAKAADYQTEGEALYRFTKATVFVAQLCEADAGRERELRRHKQIQWQSAEESEI